MPEKQTKKEELLAPDKWLDNYGDMLFRFALLRVSDRTVAEDLVQTTLTGAFKNRESFKGSSKESTWLVGILKHKIMDHFRTKNRNIPFDPDDPIQAASIKKQSIDGKENQDPANFHGSPSRVAETGEMMGLMMKCLETLPPVLKSTFILRELENLESDVICKELDITPTNLWVSLHRARTKLRGCMEEYL